MENFREFRENIVDTISKKVGERLQSKKIEMAYEMFGESIDEVLSPSDPIETIQHTNDAAIIDLLMESSDPLNEDSTSALGELFFFLYKLGHITRMEMWIITFVLLTIENWPYVYNLGSNSGKWMRGTYSKLKQWIIDRKNKKPISKVEVRKVVDGMKSLFDKIRSPEFAEFAEFANDMADKYSDAIMSYPGNNTTLLKMKRDAEKFKEKMVSY